MCRLRCNFVLGLALSFVCFVCSSVAQSCQPPPDGLVAWWAGEGNADDLLGGNAGTLVGRVSFAPGEAGQAFNLDGATGYISIPDAPALEFNGTTPMSAELWVFRTGSAGVMHILGKRAGCGSIQYQMAFDGGGIGFGTAGTTWQLPLNAWVHLAGTFDGTNFMLYTNGVVAGSGTGSLGPANSAPLEIGESGTCGQMFAGMIDEVSIYSRALSAAEVAAIYNAGAAGKCKGTNTIWVQGTCSYNTNWSTPGFLNFGTLRLETSSCGSQSAMTITSGALTNEAGGIVNVNIGAGGSRFISGSLENFGAFNDNATMTLGAPGALIENYGAMTIASGQQLAINAGGETFNQLGGTLAINGSTLFDTLAFNYTGGVINGNAVYLPRSVLTIGPAGTNAATFILTGSAATMSGDIWPGQTVWIRGDANGNHTSMTIANGFNNSGALRLESTDGGFNTYLTVANGPIVNTELGVININQGYGGGRIFRSSLFNYGTFNQNDSTTFDSTGAMIDNEGQFTIAAGTTATLSGQDFTQGSGTLQLDGGFPFYGGAFNYLGGSITGQNGVPHLINSTLALGPSATQPATIILTGSGSTMTGDIKSGQTLWMRGDGSGSHTTITVASGFRNLGVLRLESADGGFTSSLVVSSGALTNAAGGVINVNQGAGGSRTISANLLNLGAFNMNTGLSLSTANGVYENDGVFNIASGQGLTLSGQNQVFNQNAGTLQLDGSMTVSGMTFNYNGGAILGQNGTPYLVNSTLNLAPQATTPASFILTGSDSTMTGDIKPNQFIWMRGDGNGGHTTITLANGFRNTGSLKIESAGGGFSSSVAIAQGMLTNAFGGIVNINIGAGGGRSFTANVTNLGVFDVNDATAFSSSLFANEAALNFTAGASTLAASSAGALIVNDNTLNVSSGASLTMNGSGAQDVFNQNTGFLTLDGGLTLNEMVMNFNGGTINGQSGVAKLVNSTLNLAPGATSPASFILTGSGSTMTGDVKAGQSVWLRGDANGGYTTITVANGFNNAGTMRIESADGGFSSVFVVNNGILTNDTTGVFNVNIGAGGGRGITASLLNRGAFNVNDGFALSKNNATYENDGAFYVAAGQQLTVNGTLPVFTQKAGALTLDGGYEQLGGTFNFLGGQINGQTAQPHLVDVALTLGAAANGPASFILTGPASTLTGDIKAGQTVWMRGDGVGGYTTMTLTNGFSNAGTLRLESADGGYTSQLIIAGGTLTNAPGGVFNINVGQGGGRYVQANVLNSGVINVNDSSPIGKNGGGIINQGAVNIPGSQTLTAWGQYSQLSGVTTINGVLSATNTILNQGGAFTGGGTIAGNYQQTASGSLNVTLDSAAPAHLTVSGNASIAGKLRVTLANGFTPTNGSSFTVFSGSTVSGAFGALELPPLAGGALWQVGYLPGAVVLSVPATAPTNNTLTISGVVTNTQGAPISGATVYAFVDSTIQTNLIVNGSFEQPAVSGNYLVVYGGDTNTIPGWSVFGADIAIHSVFLGPAEDGAQYFDPSGVNGGGVSQTYSTVAGKAYNLVFYNGAYSIHNVISLGVTNNGVAYSFAEATSGPGLHWTQEVIPFTAAGTSTTVTFFNLQGFSYNGDDDFVDNVQVLPANAGEVIPAVTDAAGHYQIAVSDAQWQVNVAGLAALGYADTEQQTVAMNGASQTANFGAAPFAGQYYNVALQSSPSGAGIINGAGAYPSGANVSVNAAANNNAPWIFSGWSVNGVTVSTDPNYTFTIGNDLTLVANFTLPTYPLAASNNPAGAGSISGAGPYTWGTSAALTATPVFGYAFTSWTDTNGVSLGTSRTLHLTVQSNTTVVADYAATNLAHVVAAAASPANLATIGGAGTYSNGQTATLTAPAVVTNGLTYFTFSQFTVNGRFLSSSSAYPWTFATTDETNWSVTAYYNAHSVLPLVAAVYGNYSSPVGATTNFVLTVRFDRSMLANPAPAILLTNTSGGAQPAAPGVGTWSTNTVANDTYTLPAVSFSQGMDGTIAAIVSGGADLNGDAVATTNVLTFAVDATPPGISSVAVAPGALAAVITWNTTEPATSQVDSGATSVYGASSQFNGSLTTVHSVTVTGLSPSSGYHFRVRSQDQAGNLALSPDSAFTTLPAPDLQVSSVSISPNLTSGTTATVSWTVTNTGSGATFSYWYDQVTVSNSATGQLYYNASVYYDPNGAGSIPGGGARARQVSFHLPDGTNGTGPLAVLVTANVYGNQYEINYANNSASAASSATLGLYADLQVTNLAVSPASLQSGAAVTVTWQDTNSGSGAVTGSFQDFVIVSNLTTGALLASGNVEYDAPSLGPIAAGQGAARQFAFQLPNGPAGVGNMVITVTANSSASVFEYNLAGTAATNNSATLAASSALAAYPDMLATNVNIGVGSFSSGGTVLVGWTDVNQGNANVTNAWTDTVYLSSDGTTNTSQSIGSFTVTNALGAGDGLFVTRVMTLPAFVTGDYWIVVKANSANNIFELNPSNNAAVSAQSIHVASTLTFTLNRTTFAKDAINPAALGTITRSGSTASGLTVNLSSSDSGAVTVPGTVAMLPGQSSVLFALGAVNDSVVRGTRQAAVTAAAAGFTSVSNTVTVLDSTAPAITVAISTNEIGESQTNGIVCSVSRNTGTGSPVSVSIVTDLTRLLIPTNVVIPAGAASAPFTIYPIDDQLPKQSATVSVTPFAPGYVGNPGSLTILDDDAPMLGLSFRDSIVSKGAVNPATVATLSMNLALTQAVTVVLSTPSPAVTVPSSLTVASNQTNITFPINVVHDNLVTGTRLAVISARFLDVNTGAPLPAGATNSVYVTDNNGPALTLTIAAGLIPETGSTTATVTRNTPATNDLVVALISSVTNAATVPPTVTIPNGSTSATFTVSGFNPGYPTGTRRVDIVAQAANFGSGVASLNVSDVNIPDLVVGGFSMPASGFIGSNVTVNYSVANTGIAAATGSWIDNVFYSLSADGSNPQQIGQIVHNGGLGIGQKYTNSVTFTLPFQPGPCYIIAMTDAAGIVDEADYYNNTSVSTNSINISSFYTATVEADIHQAATPTAIPMHGRAYLAWDSSKPMPFAPVSIRVLTKGTRRIFNVQADTNGNFTYTFQPIPGEAGQYQIGADYPLVTEDTVQDTFDLYGMRVADQQFSLTLSPSTNVMGASSLMNLGDQPLTGIFANAYGLPSGVSLDVLVTNQLAGGQSAPLVYSLTTGAFSQPISARGYIQVSSDQGALAYLDFYLTLSPPEPVLSAAPSSLQANMLIGQQTYVELDIQNLGGAPTGPIQLQMPSAPWLSALNSTNLPSLNPGASNRVTFALTPDVNLPLQIYQGMFFVGCANSSVTVPFSFRAISSAIGAMQATVQDEYTYYASGAPDVTNAFVTVFDPYTGVIVATNGTGATGVALITNIPQGTYNMQVTAPQHESWSGSVVIKPGATAQLTPFLSRQTVTYNWTVVPTTIQDQYQIVLQSDFETEVPIPVVTIDNTNIMPLMVEDEPTEVDVQLSNHGLIAAQQVNIDTPQDDPDYVYQPLVDYMEEIPAMSTIVVPMIISWRPDSPTLAYLHSLEAATNTVQYGTPSQADFLKFDCAPLPDIAVKWGIYCGNDFHWHTIPNELVITPVEKDCFGSLIGPFKDALKEKGTTFVTDQLQKAGLGGLIPNAPVNQISPSGGFDIGKLGENACTVIGALSGCPPLANHPCLTTVLQMGCGFFSALSSGNPLNAITPALKFGNCWCPDSLPQLPQINIPKSTSPPPAHTDCPLCISSGPNAGGDFGYAGGPGCWLCDLPPIGWSIGIPCSKPGTTYSTTSGILGIHPPAQKTDNGPTTSGGDICAHVKIEIDQQVTLTRSAFKGTLTVDNNDPSNALTSFLVTLAITDDAGNSANQLFGIQTNNLSGISAVDGTGSLGAGTSGTAQFIFTPARGAAPQTVTHYQISGTISYAQGGETVQNPLLPQDIYVYPDPSLDLDYFLERDVIADDPNQPGTITPQPFYLGLMVHNSGYGKAYNFTVTSAQPKIVENSKGLLINFQITGTAVGTNQTTPSLTANMGEIDPQQTTVATWQMACTLAGKFIDYTATFQHVNELGNPQTSLIDSLNIHEMIHVFNDVRAGADGVPDFLVNDVPDPGHLPDTVYLSDGSTNSVAVITGGATDGPISSNHLSAVLTAPMTAGWNYVVVPDPGPGYRLFKAVRSDGVDMKAPYNVWTTPLSFPASQTGAVHENLAHLIDYNGTGSYTLYYHTTNTIAPTIVQFTGPSPFVQGGPISFAQITFSEAVDLATFDYHSLNLSLNGGANLITSNVTVTLVSGSTYAINGLYALTGAAGNYQLTFTGASVQDSGGNNIAGANTASVSWANGNAPVVVQSLDAVSPAMRNSPVSSLNVTFDKAINASTFDYHDLTLTQNGTNLSTTSLTVTPVTSSTFQIGGLAALTGGDGVYLLTVSAAGVADSGGAPGQGSVSTSWTVITTGPSIVATQYVQSPRNIVLQSLDVTFSHAIDPSTFDYHDITLTHDGGPNIITPVVTVKQISPTVCEIANFNWVSGYDGAYVMTINATGVSDLAGNAGTGAAVVSWQMSTLIPVSPTNFMITPDTGVYTNDAITASNNVTISGLAFGTNVTVNIVDETANHDYGLLPLSGGLFSLPATLASGKHEFDIRAVDAAGNTSADRFFDVFVDNTTLTASLDAIAPNPRTTPVTNINVTFSERIDTNSLRLTNVSLTLNGSNALTPTLTALSSNVFQIGGLDALTAGVGAYQLSVNLNGVSGVSGISGSGLVTEFWARTINATNIPVIAAILNHTVTVGSTLRIATQVTDPAVPPLILTYSLLSGAPQGAAIDPNTGVFQWTPNASQAGTSNYITIKVVDNGFPQQGATQSFAVIVQKNLQLTIGSATVFGGASSNIAIGLSAETALTNLTFTLNVPTNLFSSLSLQANSPQLALASLAPTPTNTLQVSLGAVAGQTFGASPQMALLSFSASNQSAFVPLVPQSLQWGVADGSSLKFSAQPGRIVIVGTQPLVEALVATNHKRSLSFYGTPGDAYVVQSSTDLVTWIDSFRVPMTNISATFTNLTPANGTAYYRAHQFVTVAPIADVLNHGQQVVLYGAPGDAYEVDYTSSIGGPWIVLERLPMTNAFQFVNGLAAANRSVFYRFNQLKADPPALQATLSGGVRGLVAFGLAGSNYILQYATNFGGGPASWHSLTNYSLSNSFQSFGVTNAVPSVFYRIERH